LIAPSSESIEANVDNYIKHFDHFIAQTVAKAAERAPAFAARLDAVGLMPKDFNSVADLTRLPVLRKDNLIDLQRTNPPFGGLLMVEPGTLRRIYRSPGPINEPEGNVPDYWRWKSAFEALGVQPGEIILNAFAYHLTPAGAMMEEGARAIGAALIPGGVGNQEAQIALLTQLPVMTYIGLPSYLHALLKMAEELGHDPHKFALRRAFVTAEPLPSSLRKALQDYGLTVRQGYGTAEVGNLGYECEAENGWHVPEDALVQVCDLSTGEPLPPGQTGEVVVTLFNDTYSLIRFGVGDLSAWHTEPCVCGRWTPRLVGWQGRVGDAVKVRGMFLHPSQATALMARFAAVRRFQFAITRENHRDDLTCRVMVVPGAAIEREVLEQAIRDGLRLHADIELVEDISDGAPILIDKRDWNQ
jgi:phenylacetate-CoA ligase